MQVSKLIGFLVIALLGLCLCIITPLTAGEHPWNEDQATGGDPTDTNGIVISNGDPDDDGDGGTPNESVMFGTPWFWYQMIILGPTGDPSTGIEATGTGSSVIEPTTTEESTGSTAK